MGFKLPWREAGPPNHHGDKADSDQEVVNKELSRSAGVGLQAHAHPLLRRRHHQGPYFAEMCSGSEAGSYLRLIDFVYHSTLGPVST